MCLGVRENSLNWTVMLACPSLLLDGVCYVMKMSCVIVIFGKRRTRHSFTSDSSIFCRFDECRCVRSVIHVIVLSPSL